MIERIHRLIKHETTAPNSVIELLSNTVIGTEGSLYQLLDTPTKVHQLHKPHFLFIERNEKAIGNVTICEREVQLNNSQQDTLYLRYFAFDQIFQGGKDKGNANSNFHTYLKKLFETSNYNPVDAENKKSVYWAFIDPQNARSLNMNSLLGFETIGTFKTTAFSRVNPKSNSQVFKITQADKEEVRGLAAGFYSNFDFYSEVHLFDNDDYYVFKEDGQIVAGIQANPIHWKIKSLPGASGKFLMKAAPFIPRIRKLINPKSHKFLATEGLFWKKGHEDKVEALLEGVLSKTQRNSLLIWTDHNNAMLDKLEVKWGFIQKSKKDNRINIVAKFNKYGACEIENIKESKKYLSGFDMT